MNNFPLKGSQQRRIHNADMTTKITILENGTIDVETSFHPKSTLPPIISTVIFLADSNNNILFSTQHTIHKQGHVGVLNKIDIWNDIVPEVILKKVTNYAIYHADTLILSPYTSEDLKKWSETISSLIQTFQEVEDR